MVVGLARAVLASLVMDNAASIGFGRYILSATRPFTPRGPRGLEDERACSRRALRARFQRVYGARG